MDSVVLYEEFRLIERNEGEISVVWRGAHQVLFFLAFVFGSFCTFFFHVLMYMFDQKCVLFPEIVPHASLRKIVYDFFIVNANDEHNNAENPTRNDLPMVFMSTQWKDDTVCYLPTYVPLLSGLGGLIWTTMFHMCSSGTSSAAGMQRQWRALPLIFVFSVAMGSLCIYSSTITSNGLEVLCTKLGHLTGSNSCSYTINVATLAYERRIRGVYQATQLTIATSWLHTTCWLLSALLTFLRVLFAIDFQLVCVKVHLIGDIERMMEKYERHIRNVSPDSTAALTEDRLSYAVDDMETAKSNASSSGNEEKGKRKEKEEEKEKEKERKREREKEKEKDVFYVHPNDAIFLSELVDPPSQLSLFPEEIRKLSVEAVLSEQQFIAKLVLDLVEDLELPISEIQTQRYNIPGKVAPETKKLHRQHGLENVITTPLVSSTSLNINSTNIKVVTSEVKLQNVGSPKASITSHHPKKSSLKTRSLHASSARKVHILGDVMKLKDVEKNENQSEVLNADEIEIESEDKSEDESENESENEIHDEDEVEISTRDENDKKPQSPSGFD